MQLGVEGAEMRIGGCISLNSGLARDRGSYQFHKIISRVVDVAGQRKDAIY
jgi:hypothetical protein